MEINPDIFIQGGAVGIAVALIMYSAYKDRMTAKTLEKFNTTMNDHLQHIDKIMQENVRAVQRGNDLRSENISVIRANTQAFARLEGILSTYFNNTHKTPTIVNVDKDVNG